MNTTGAVPSRPLERDPLIEEVTPKGLLFESGDENEDVARVQEHLTLRGYKTKVDGIFGTATKGALSRFQSEEMSRHQRSNKDFQRGVIGYPTWEALIKPFKKAFRAETPTPPHQNAPTTFAEALQRTIQSHLKGHPREVGGENRGPWVRAYMQGKDGAHLPWCAGFVCTVLHQACAWYGTEAPLPYNWGVDQLWAQGLEKGRHATLKDVRKEFSKGWTPCPFVFCIPGGDLPSGETDYVHTGFVTDLDDHIITAEGNTNDEGSREGYEACSRFRSVDNLAFINLRPND